MISRQHGYGSEGYAASFADCGRPRRLSNCDGWLLERGIGDSGRIDAMGCYPLFTCRNWSGLQADLEALADTLVSVAVVADPLGYYTPETLSATFPDVCRPFKDHFLIDFCADWRGSIAEHHRRNVRFAQNKVTVERVADPASVADEWIRLYENLVERHGIKGLTAFSRGHFHRLLGLQDIRAYRATIGGQTAGMLLWMLQADSAYYHLGAYSESGYATKASYALFDFSLNELCADGFRRANLGGAAGTSADASGLSRFKAGWSNTRRPSFVCGRVLDRKTYDRLTVRLHPQPTSYFPAYRSGEFA